MTRLKVFVAASSICIIGFVLSHIRLDRKLRKDTNDNEAEVKFLRKQSHAFRKLVEKHSRTHRLVRDQWNLVANGNGKVENLMSTNPRTFLPGTSVDEAIELLTSIDNRCAVVTDEDGNMLGVVSTSDLSRKIGRTVGDVMTENPKTTTPDTELRVALSMMIQNRISCLPVLENDCLVGLVSNSDFLVALQCLLVSLNHDGEREREPAATHEDVAVPV